MHNRMDKIGEDHQMMVGPMNSVRKQLDELSGDVEFPVARTIVATRVWYREDEDLDKVA